jgi:hypothetical protein
MKAVGSFDSDPGSGHVAGDLCSDLEVCCQWITLKISF